MTAPDFAAILGVSERLSDEVLAALTLVSHPFTPQLARELPSSRKLIADLLALHAERGGDDGTFRRCAHDLHGWPCPTVRLIEAHRD